ncbi:hypothetical protein WDW37_13860 [Bdellovibrionota bacterium FG-1]
MMNSNKMGFVVGLAVVLGVLGMGTPVAQARQRITGCLVGISESGCSSPIDVDVYSVQDIRELLGEVEKKINAAMDRANGQFEAAKGGINQQNAERIQLAAGVSDRIKLVETGLIDSKKLVTQAETKVHDANRAFEIAMNGFNQRVLTDGLKADFKKSMQALVRKEVERQLRDQKR